METLPKIQTIEIQLDKTLLEVYEESQVIVHCHIWAITELKARIWPTTYLFPHEGGDPVPLLHAENITYAPYWTILPAYSRSGFTLIFGGLPKNCQSFDLIEVANDGFCPFNISGIKRSQSDVYTVHI